MNVLVVAAHPDDEVLGCGATIARLAREGASVHIAILGEGITSRYADATEADPAELESLHKRAHDVAKLLDAKGLSLHKLPDNRFDTVPLLEVVKTVESLVVKHKPEVIYTHHGGDLNVDHQITFRAVLTATRPVPGQTVREILAFEVPSSTEWGFQGLEPVFRPNVFTDITGTLELKLRAMERYESEAREFPHPRSRQALEAIARRWGSVAGFAAAEAFELIRSLRP
jgi:LmbE family N-acetylglucosaminyl deacetylase